MLQQLYHSRSYPRHHSNIAGVDTDTPPIVDWENVQMQRLSSYDFLMSHGAPHSVIELDRSPPDAYTTSALLPERQAPSQRRRHSSYQAIRRLSYDLDADAIFMKVCQRSCRAVPYRY